MCPARLARVLHENPRSAARKGHLVDAMVDVAVGGTDVDEYPRPIAREVVCPRDVRCASNSSGFRERVLAPRGDSDRYRGAMELDRLAGEKALAVSGGRDCLQPVPGPGHVLVALRQQSLAAPVGPHQPYGADRESRFAGRPTKTLVDDRSLRPERTRAAAVVRQRRYSPVGKSDDEDVETLLRSRAAVVHDGRTVGRKAGIEDLASDELAPLARRSVDEEQPVLAGKRQLRTPGRPRRR